MSGTWLAVRVNCPVRDVLSEPWIPGGAGLGRLETHLTAGWAGGILIISSPQSELVS